MGMFDTIKCDVPLPDGFTGGWLQSKDFDCDMDVITITADGRLTQRYVYSNEPVPESEWKYKNREGALQDLWHEQSKTKPVYVCRDLEFHGIFRFYASEGKRDDGTWKWHEYRAKFTDGQLVKIEQIPEENEH